MNMCLRWLGRTAWVAFYLVRIWACLVALDYLSGPVWALPLAALLLWLRRRLILQAAVGMGALMVWHWNPIAALLLAAPRLVLVLPGLIATFLANRRHPRPQWSNPLI